MEILREVKHELTWHNDSDGKFNVTIINNSITALSFCEPGKDSSSECGKCITSTDYRFLKQVHTCLGELFEHIDSEAKKAGHSFAGEETVTT